MRRSLPPLILASASPRRRVLLRIFGIPFRVTSPGVDERHRHTRPAGLVADNARLKAEWMRGRRSRGLVLSADTLVTIDGRVLGKPTSAAEARAMLLRLSGRVHRVYSGICFLDLETERVWEAVDSSAVRLRRLSTEEIRRYVASGAAMDKAGAYAIQDMRWMMVDRIEGSISTVIGLPLHVVEQGLKRFGVR